MRTRILVTLSLVVGVCARAQAPPDPGAPALPDAITLDPSLVAPLGPGDELLPMGVWLRVGEAYYFSYLDAHAGPSIAADIVIDGLPVHMTRRVSSIGSDVQVLDDAARVAAGLPTAPDWLAAYGPQPTPGSLWGAWRVDPALRGRFHSAEYPDDLQVVVYRGTAARMKGTPEIVWVRVLACADGVCEGRMLNEPFHIPKLHEGDVIAFRTNVGPGEPLVMSGP